MNNDLRDELITLMSNYEPQVCGDCQVKIIANCAKFINNVSYMTEIKKLLDLFFIDTTTFNFFVELPKITQVIIDYYKNNIITLSKDIDPDHMKFIIYGVLYSYLDNFQSTTLNTINGGDFRIAFINVLSILFVKSKSIKINKLSLFGALFNCICGDDGKIKL